MRVGLTFLFDFWFENHASQAASTENFPFWVQENGPVLENAIVFEKIVNLSKNFQKLFCKQSMLNEQGTYSLRRATSDRRLWKIAPGLKRVDGNGKLPLVWMAAHDDSWQWKVAPCLDGAAAARKQSSLVVVELLDTEMTKTVTTNIWTQSPWKVLATGLWDEIETIAWTETLWKRWGLDFMMKLPTYPRHGNQASRSSR